MILTDCKEGPALALFLHPSAFTLLPAAPFPLQNVKEQARGRPTDSILPRYYGTSNNKCKKFFHAKAVSMPGREFSGGFFPRRGTTLQIPICWD
jgi:hypothetical protein